VFPAGYLPFIDDLATCINQDQPTPKNNVFLLQGGSEIIK
jgi:hypothetical protein